MMFSQPESVAGHRRRVISSPGIRQVCRSCNRIYIYIRRIYWTLSTRASIFFTSFHFIFVFKCSYV